MVNKIHKIPCSSGNYILVREETKNKKKKSVLCVMKGNANRPLGVFAFKEVVSVDEAGNVYGMCSVYGIYCSHYHYYSYFIFYYFIIIIVL